jgi:hypothetical protein
MDHGSWDSRRCRCQGRHGALLAEPLGGVYGPPCVFLVRKSPCTSLPAYPIPEASQRLRVGPRNKHDGYRPIARRDGNRVRGYDLVGQVSLDSRLPPVPSGPLNHRGRGSGLGWNGPQVGFRRLHSHAHDERVFLYAFDLLELNSEDYRQHPLEKRKAKLEKILARTQGMRLLRSYSHCARAD